MPSCIKLPVRLQMQKLILLMATFLLNGCVGVAAGTYGKHQLAKDKFGLLPERNEFSFASRTYTEDEVIALWGEPDSRETKGACTVLGFKAGTSWSGAGLFVGLAPVPLVLPSGNYWNYIYTRGQTTVGAVVEYGEVKKTVGVMCGSNECSGGAGEAGNAPEQDAAKVVMEWCDVPA
jgi:hypothetical protein